LPSPNPKKRKTESKAKPGKRAVKMTPQTLGERKIKVPPTTLNRKGVILPTNACQAKQCWDNDMGLHCLHTAISYTDFSSLAKIVLPGQMSIQSFIQMQKDDKTFGPIYKNINTKRGYTLIDGLLFKNTQNSLKPVLPTALLPAVINTKHYTVVGLHQSQTRIKRDIDSKYHTDSEALRNTLTNICSKCPQCQYNNTKQDPHLFKSTDFAIAPRCVWAVDIIPSMTTTIRGHCAVFLAIDMFTAYVQLKAIKSRRSDELVEAIKDTILIPFGAPQCVRSDNETGMQNSVMFKNFLDNLGITYVPCSTASPWSNGAAERAIQTVKKAIKTFLQMESETDNWDDYIHIYTEAHNKSTNVHGYSPEELHFGYSNPHRTDLIQLWPDSENTDKYIENIIKLASSRRREAQEKVQRAKKNTITYRNKSRRLKSFETGQLVLHRQLQVSTGTGGSLQPNFTGPYVIEQIEPQNSSAIIKHLHTNQTMHAHFTNLQLLEFDPIQTRVPSRFDDFISEYIPTDKYSQSKYYPGHQDAREILNQIRKDKLQQVNRAFNEAHPRPPNNDIARTGHSMTTRSKKE